jgi:hypothetical protein
LDYTKWLILPDTQWPYVDTRSLSAVLQYASEHYWDGVLQLGDFMDWDWISRWTVDNKRIKEGKRFKTEYDRCGEFLDNILASVRRRNKNARFVILEGNHDWRVQKEIDKDPRLEGLIEMPVGLKFKERKVEYYPYWTTREPFRIGKARFIHGEFTNKYHAAKTVDNFGHSVFYGHTHDHQLHSKAFRGENETVVGESLGTLCKYDMDYMGKKPSNWQQGFAVFYFLDDGYFNHYYIDIFKHRFLSPEGVLYQG